MKTLLTKLILAETPPAPMLHPHGSPTHCCCERVECEALSFWRMSNTLPGVLPHYFEAFSPNSITYPCESHSKNSAEGLELWKDVFFATSFCNSCLDSDQCHYLLFTSLNIPQDTDLVQSSEDWSSEALKAFDFLSSLYSTFQRTKTWSEDRAVVFIYNFLPFFFVLIGKNVFSALCTSSFSVLELSIPNISLSSLFQAYGLAFPCSLCGLWSMASISSCKSLQSIARNTEHETKHVNHESNEYLQLPQIQAFMKESQVH